METSSFIRESDIKFIIVSSMCHLKYTRIRIKSFVGPVVNAQIVRLLHSKSSMVCVCLVRKLAVEESSSCPAEEKKWVICMSHGYRHDTLCAVCAYIVFFSGINHVMSMIKASYFNALSIYFNVIDGPIALLMFGSIILS